MSLSIHMHLQARTRRSQELKYFAMGKAGKMANQHHSIYSTCEVNSDSSTQHYLHSVTQNKRRALPGCRAAADIALMSTLNSHIILSRQRAALHHVTLRQYETYSKRTYHYRLLESLVGPSVVW
jgi:hypothetical protein